MTNKIKYIFDEMYVDLGVAIVWENAEAATVTSKYWGEGKAEVIVNKKELGVYPNIVNAVIQDNAAARVFLQYCIDLNKAFVEEHEKNVKVINELQTLIKRRNELLNILEKEHNIHAHKSEMPNTKVFKFGTNNPKAVIFHISTAEKPSVYCEMPPLGFAILDIKYSISCDILKILQELSSVYVKYDALQEQMEVVDE